MTPPEARKRRTRLVATLQLVVGICLVVSTLVRLNSWRGTTAEQVIDWIIMSVGAACIVVSLVVLARHRRTD